MASGMHWTRRSGIDGRQRDGYQNYLLKINDLEVIYKTDLETVRAVNGVSLDLAEGETLGLVGETGAGKTTLALSILQLLPGSHGTYHQWGYPF